jgi:hypothetical protein
MFSTQRYFKKVFLLTGRHYESSTSLETNISSLRQRAYEVGSNLFLNLKKKWIAASLLTLLLAMTHILPSQAAWFNGSWSSREKITVKASKINGDLTEFPIYLNLADMPDSFFSTVNGTGADIRITQGDEISETSFELVDLDTVNGTGELWFKAPTLSSTIDTNFYIYFGNTSSVAYADSDPYGAHDVWSNGYVAVYHMNEDPTGIIKDSTSFGNNGTSAGAMTSGDLVKGSLGKAIEFDGTDDEIVSSFSTSISDQITVSSIIKSDTISVVNVIVSEYGSAEGWLLLNTNTGAIGFDGRDGVSYKSSGKSIEIDDNEWHHTIGQKEGSEWRVFSDSILSSNADVGFVGDINATQQIHIGAHSNNTGFKFEGFIDEVRIANKVRLDSWISTEYQNQNSPGNFYLISNGQGAGFDQNLWPSSHKITIPHYIFDEDLENFPVYVNLADLPTNFFSIVQADGRDIRVTSSDQDSQQAFELVGIDTVNGTGELWFKAETLSSIIDNSFYIWYGNTEAQAYSRTDEFGSENVWSNGFVAVYHMNEDPIQGQVLDSTINRNNISGSGLLDLNSGHLGNSIIFNGSTDVLTSSNNVFNDWSSTNINSTVWFKANVVNTSCIFGQTNTGNINTASGYVPGIHIGNDDNLYSSTFWHGSTSATNNLGITQNGVWTHASINHASGEESSFLDGNFIVSTPRTQSSYSASYYYHYGACDQNGWSGGVTGEYLNGSISFFSMSRKDHSRDWIKTEYNNQNSPGTFYTTEKVNRGNAVMFGRMF